MSELVPPSPLPSPWWANSGPRSLAASIVAVVLAAMSALVLTVPSARPAAAAAPVDRRPVTANDPSELGWSGFLLSDPSRSSGHYWAGAYATLAGDISYCVDEFYDYPRSSYGYRRVEATQWAARRSGAIAVGPRAGHRIAWILNTVGPARDRVTTTAVSMAVNLLTGSPTFATSYRRYLRPQLALLDSRIVPLVSSLLLRSDLFAGPYTTRVTFGPAPSVGGVGEVRLSVRSANGTALRGAQVRVRSLTGGAIVGRSSGISGVDGLVHLRYRATRSGAVALVADGVAPAPSLTLGYSPTHSGPSYARGSQRVVTWSSTPRRSVAAGSGSVVVSAPVVVSMPVLSTSAVPTASSTRAPVESSASTSSAAPVVSSPVAPGTSALGSSSPTPPPTPSYPTASAPTSAPSFPPSGSVSSSSAPSAPSSPAPVTMTPVAAPSSSPAATVSVVAPSSLPVATAPTGPPSSSSSSAPPTGASTTSGPIIVVIRPPATAPTGARDRSPAPPRPAVTSASPVRGTQMLATTGANLEALTAAIGALGLGIVLLVLGRVARRRS